MRWFFTVTLLISATCLAAMETVKLAPSVKGFVLHPSGARYIPWGHNYASVDILKRLAENPERVDREFAEMKAVGTTVARIHPEMPRILVGPGQVDQNELNRWQITEAVVGGQIAPWQREFAKERGLPIVDIYELTKANEAGSYCDGIHPNDKGYALIAEAFAAKLRELAK